MQSLKTMQSPKTLRSGKAMRYFFTKKFYLRCAIALLFVANSVTAEENGLANNDYALNRPAIETIIVQGYRVNP